MMILYTVRRFSFSNKHITQFNVMYMQRDVEINSNCCCNYKLCVSYCCSMCKLELKYM